MLALSGLAVAALSVLAALIVYGLAWWATSGRSYGAKILVRGGLLLLIAVPLAGFLLLSPAMHRAADEREPQLSSPLQDELLREAEQGARQQTHVQPREAQPLDEAARSGARSMGEERAQPGAADPAAGSGPPPAAAETADDTWSVVPVFFGTDREGQADAQRLRYSAERGRRLELGRAMVTVPKMHEVPNIERPWVVKIPYFDVTIYEEAEDPEKHFTLQEIKKLREADFLALTRERIAASSRYKDHALVFVQGYNSSFDNALYRTAQIAYDLKFDGAAFLYSWPSGGAVASYTYDRESAQASEPYLRQFLDLVVKQTGAKSVSIIAHSMGSQPLMDVLKDMRSGGPQEVAINEVILAAPDVDADNFANLAQRIEGIAKGVTLYAASNDRALIISRSFWRNPRAGDVPATGPLIVPGIETIDVTAASLDSFALNHSGYAENNDLLQDIGKLILSGLRPPDQRLPALKRTSSPKGDFWRYTAP
jgi:esterase/lipase superfamily enzyme